MAEDDRSVTTSLSWRYDIPLLTSRFMLWDYARVIVISIAMMYALVFFAGWVIEGEPVVLPLLVGLVVGIIMVVLFFLAVLLLGARHGAVFTVDELGVTYAAEVRERRINRAVAIIGALAGSATTAGAGLLASSRETLSVPWSEIQAVRVYAGPRVISLRNGWRTVLRLHCPPELFDEVVARVDSGWRSAERARVAPPENRTARAPWYVYVARAGGVAILAVGTQVWYWTDSELATRMGLLGAACVMASVVSEGAGRRLMPLLALPLLVWQAGAVLLTAIQPIEGLFGVSYVATLDPLELAVTVGSIAALAGIALQRLLGEQR